MHNKKTLEHYDKIVDQYVSQNQYNETVERQRKLFVSLLNGKSVLDVGSGMGRDTEAFRKEGLNVLGIDGSLSMLNKAKKLYPNSSFTKFNLLEDDYSKFGLYNGIWCCASLLHFTPEEMNIVFDNLLKHLYEDGIVYFSLKTDNTMYECMSDNRWFQIYTKLYLDNFVKDFNMEIIHYEENVSPSLQTFSNYFIKRSCC